MNASVREAVLSRAGDWCEACEWPHGDRGEIDHFLGGRGRKRQMESVETCWLLCMPCAKDRTDNRPSAAFWNERFKAHAERNFLPVIAHMVHAPVVRR